MDYKNKLKKLEEKIQKKTNSYKNLKERERKALEELNNLKDQKDILEAKIIKNAVGEKNIYEVIKQIENKKEGGY